MDTENERFKFLALAFDTFMSNSPDMFFAKDINLRYLVASQAFAEMMGHKDASTIIGKTDFDIFPKDLAAKYIQDDCKVLSTGVSLVGQKEKIPKKNGKRRYSSTWKGPIKDVDGTIVGIFGTGLDITLQVELAEEKERTALSNKMFADVLEGDITDDLLIKAEGTAWAKHLNPSESPTFSGAVKNLEAYVHPDYKEEFRQRYNREHLLLEYENGTREFSHIVYQTVNGTDYQWMEFSSRLYYSETFETLRIVTFLRDMNDEIVDRQKLTRTAETDPLTGLYNRGATIEKMNACITDDGAAGTHALLFVDLDFFKQANDHLGHPFGDRILIEIATRLKALFAENGIVGRIGGDEFLVLMKDVPSEDFVRTQAGKLIDSAYYYHYENGFELRLTCSVGIAMYKGNGKTLKTLYAEADSAMYKAKRKGKKQAAFYE